MSKGLAAVLAVALMAAPSAGLATAPRPPAKRSAPAAQTPPAIAGRWIAVSTTAMGITGDIALGDGQLRTRKGSIPLRLEFMRLPNFDGEAWISKIGPTAHLALVNGNQFCPHMGYPDQGRWMVISHPASDRDRLEIDVYEAWEMPVQFGTGKPYYCGGLRYQKDDRSAAGRASKR